ARGRAGSRGGASPSSPLARTRWDPHRGSAERGRARGGDVRRGMVGPRAAATPLALLAGDPSTSGGAGGRPRGLDLARGEAALLLVEPRLQPAGWRLVIARPGRPIAAEPLRAPTPVWART